MTITREQVERAIEAARADEGGISDALGGWQWDKRAPDYVRVAWGKSSLPDFIAALTRWHAELAAAEPESKTARWQAGDPFLGERAGGWYELTPRYMGLSGPGIIRTPKREDVIAWGYTIEGGPEPVDDTAPERLRERREALGWDLAQAAEKAGWHMDDIHALEGVCPVPAGIVCKRCPEARVDYAAALIAAEAERARPAIDPLAYTDSPAWDEPPVRRPAPEVVDVPQPEPWHARLVRLAQEAQAAGAACAEAEAAFARADAEREKARLARAAAREVCHVKRQALTEATTAAAIIRDAQRHQDAERSKLTRGTPTHWMPLPAAPEAP